MDFTDTLLIQNTETNDVNPELDDEAPEQAGPGTEGIAKPPGEPGRPNSGGYCLETALLANGWSKSTYDKILVSAHSICDGQTTNLTMPCTGPGPRRS